MESPRRLYDKDVLFVLEETCDFAQMGGAEEYTVCVTSGVTPLTVANSGAFTTTI